ncbi:hypothetical protein H0H87_005866 [Tephrocybe sp. NHM501043]|nr:hypothetical protein H0H87_005866 [Tephrocybe sp. NHM501043]
MPDILGLDEKSLDNASRPFEFSDHQPVVLPVSSLSNAHLSDYTTSTAIHRRDTFMTTSLKSPAETIVESHSPIHKGSPGSSVTEFIGDEPEPLEWLKFRLASGFFAYFLCGWGDGVTGTVLPCEWYRPR